MIEHPEPDRRMRDGDECEVYACVGCDSAVFVILYEGYLACPGCGAVCSFDVVADALRKRQMH